MFSGVPPKDRSGVFSAGPPAASSERRAASRADELAEELAMELVMAAIVVVVACILLTAAIAVAYCSAKSAVCRELLSGGWQKLR